MGFSLFGKNKQSASDADTDEMEGKAPPRRRKKNAEQPVDPVLPEKKRARRRLVGAAAMVLAAIIGLPMLLESEPQPLADDVQVYIPSIDKPPVKVKIASADEASQSEELADAPEQQAKSAAAATVAPTAQPPSGPAASPVTATASSAVPATKTAGDDKTAKLPVASKTPTPAVTTASKSELPKSTQEASSTERERAAKVQALLAGRGAETAGIAKASAQTAQEGRFALQVAALGSPEKARELQDKLSKAGIKSYTEKVKVSGSEQIRVRVGPFASREEADKMRGKLSDIGLNGMVMPL